MTIQMIETQVLIMTPDEARRCVHEIHSGLSSLREKIYDLWIREGWKSLGYLSWTECVENEFPESRRHVFREFSAAKIETNLVTNWSLGTIPESQLRPLTSLEPETQKEVWRIANETAPEGRITARHVQSVVDEFKRPVSYHVSDDSYEWYTPIEYIEAARGVMSSIDLDPASSDNAQKLIQAGTYFTKTQDGLKQRWFGNVWLNPPYNMPLIEQFIDKVVRDYETGLINAAIVLTNNSTDTNWFHKLIVYPVCFTKGRIKFYSGNESLATRQGQALFYLGDNSDLFAKIFGNFGVVLKRYDY